MAVQKNFIVKNGLQVNNNLLFVDGTVDRIGIGTTIPENTLDVIGGIGATSINISGVGTVSDLTVNNIAAINSATINTGIVTNAYINTGIVTNLTSDNGYITSLLGININYNGIGTVTNLNSTTATLTTVNNRNLRVTGIASINTGVVTTANITTGIVTTLTGTTLNYSGIGTVTTFNSTTGTLNTINNANLRTSGIASINSGILTTGSITTLTGTTLNYSGIGTITTFNATTSTVTTENNTNLRVSGIASINSGILTTGSITTLTGTTLNYSGIGTVTNLNSTTANISNLNVSGGIVTASSFVGSGSNLTGIVTQIVAGTGITISPVGGTGSVTINATGGVGGGSSLGVYDDFPNFIGVVTSIDFGANLSVSPLSSGIVTVTTSDNVAVSGIASINTGVVTTANITTGIVTTLTGTTLNYGGIGTITTLNSTTSNLTTVNNANLRTSGIASINSGILTTGSITTLTGTTLSYGGIGTITTFNATTSTVTTENNANLRVSGIASINSGIATNFSVTGISTLKNTTVGGATTELVVVGDARITGILSVGSGTITLNGLTDTIRVGTGVTINGTTGIISASSINTTDQTTLTNLRVSGISTLGSSNGIGTVTVGVGTTALSVQGSVRVTGNLAIGSSTFISNSSARIVGLNYPSVDGLPFQSLVTDGQGNIGFATANILYANRIYVSERTGNDLNDGRNAPVRTIKKATQLASLQGGLVAIFVETGNYVEDNPILVYDDIAIIGDNLRNTYIRPANAGKDMFRVRNGCYVTGFTLRDNVTANIPQYTFNYAVAFDDPTDATTSRVGYASTSAKPVITRSPYIQNCSIISFLGANGVLVDGDKVLTPNSPSIAQEAENPVAGGIPEQGKSIVANAFTMVSFGGVGFRAVNDGYAQMVSCFQIFCQDGSLAESGGYLSITNSATNFGTNALRSRGFSANSFTFDRGIIAANSVVNGQQSLKVLGLGSKDQVNYVLRFFNKSLQDKTPDFKNVGLTTVTFNGVTGVNTVTNEITSASHGLTDSDTVIYTQSSSGPLGGLTNKTEYYVDAIGINTFRLCTDISLTKVVDITSTSSGIHTLNKQNNVFYADRISSYHSNYQQLTLNSTSYTFVPGRLVTQSSTSAVGYALTYISDKLIVSKESTVDFAAGTIQDHAGTPATATINSAVGISTYYTVDVLVGSTETGETIQNIASLKENYFCHFHRPSIVNSSAHTWEYAGSGNDYNALPQNGGKTNPLLEQVEERGGQVYSSGTNELGDFKVGDAITAFNRTGDITFNNTVTIGELTSLQFSVSGGPVITEISTDVNLGDSEPGGAQDYRITTQKAQRSFLNNRLGSFIDKTASTSGVPNAVVVLNSSGQINSDLVPASRENNYFLVTTAGGRLSLVDDVPANELLAGDVVVEDVGVSTITYRLINDRDTQYLVLSDSTRNYNFSNNTQITAVNTGSVGIVTTPSNVGYGTTGLVKGVFVTGTLSHPGSGYSDGVYSNVSIASSTGVGSSVTADVTISGGQVSNIDYRFGGKNYAVNDVLRITSGIPQSGVDYARITVNSVQTRLYTKITNNIKFAASLASPDFIQDNSAVGLGTTLTTVYSTTFDAATNVDTALDRIIVGTNAFSNGDPVIYSPGAGTVVGGLTTSQTYYVKKVGVSSVELYTNYGLTNIIDLSSTGTGTQTLARVGVNTSANFIVLSSHGYTSGDAVKVTGNNLPSGLTANGFYFVGSATSNAFTLHSLRADSLSSINGLTVDPVSLGSTGSGIATFTKQNVQFIDTVNTSSISTTNYSVLSSNNIDASNIVSGTISPTRLGSGSATIDTFLSGNQTYQKVVKGVGIGSTEPISATGSAGFDSTVSISTYYGNVNLSLTRINGSLGDSTYTNNGVARFKKSTFAFDGDGAVRIKTAAQGGDVDADKLDSYDGAYYLDPVNLSSPVPINKGGTNLTSAPVAGSILVGNGVAYDLTIDPRIGGNVAAVSIGVTNLSVTGIATISNLNINTGFVTTFGSSNLRVSGIASINTGVVTTANINTGIVTTLTGTTLSYGGIGTITTFNSTTGTLTTIDNANLRTSGIASINTGVVTTANITTGIITTLTGTTLNYGGIGTITTFNSTTGTLTTIDNANLRTSGIASINSGILTTASITTLTGTTLNYSGIGTITTLDTTNFEALGIASINTGVVTTANITTGIVTTLTGTTLSYGGIGTITTFNSTTGTLNTINNTNLRTSGIASINSGILTTGSITTLTGTTLDYSGIGTITTFNATTGTLTTIDNANLRTSGIASINSGILTTGSITTLTGTTLNYSGIGTITTFNSTTGTLTTIDNANLRTSGIASINTGVVTTANITTGIITTLSGTTLNYSGFGTVGSLSIGAVQVISSGRQLQNIASLDATTTATIESAIQASPNVFNDLSVTGLSTFTNGPVLIGSGTSTGTSAQRLQVTDGAYISGKLGIGTTNPMSTLDVLGDVNVSGVITCTDINSASDINLKDNIQTFTNALDVVNDLRGVRFEWKKDGRPSIGVVAQELESVLPELVNGNDPKTVNYNGLIGVLIEAIKELSQEVQELKSKLNN